MYIHDLCMTLSFDIDMWVDGVSLDSLLTVLNLLQVILNDISH